MSQVNGGSFDEQGYIHVKGFFSEAEIDQLRADIEAAGRSLKEQSILNKGNMTFLSAIYRVSPRLQDFVCQDRLIAFLTPYLGPDFWVRWDQCVCKGPGAPEFPWHQDNAYNGLTDQHYQLWVAVSATTRDNGGLWVAPGSHRKGPLPHHLVGKHQVADEAPANPVLIEADRGDLVLFSSFMLHHTKANVSTGDRWAYVIEYMKNEHYDPYVDGPYFIAARNGRRVQQFVKSYPGSRSFGNHAKYFGKLGAANRFLKLAPWRGSATP